MTIVAISQTLGSLGDEIGRDLPRTLSGEFADRMIIAQAAQRFGEGLMERAHSGMAPLLVHLNGAHPTRRVP